MYQELSTLNTGSTLVPMTLCPSSSAGVLLMDFTLGDTVGAQEWIARELGRIREDTNPRHCRDYEDLLQVIEEMSRYVPASPSVPTTPTDTTHNKSSLPPSPTSTIANGDAPFATSGSVSAAPYSTTPHQQRTNSKPTALLRFCDLEMALVHIIQYNQRCDADCFAHTTSSSHPARLLQMLNDLDAMRENDEGRIADHLEAQQHLFSILFGEVRLTSQLVAQWRIVCQWAKQLSGARDWHTWMNFGLDAFVKARRRCCSSGSGSGPVNSPTKSASSSSTNTSASREHQKMIEQLPALLHNTHLVEEYQA